MSATMVPLGELCEIASGGTPRRSIIKYWENGSIPWLKISDLAGKHISMAEETITYAGLENSSAKLFEPGTILVSIFATIGVAGILDIPATTNQAIAGIKPFDSTTLSPEYLYYWIIAQKEKMEASGRGVAQNNINLSYLRSLQIPLPDMERQRSIIAIFSMFDELFEYSKGRLQRFDDLVKSRFIEMFGAYSLNPQFTSWTKIKELGTVYGGATPKTKDERCWNGEFRWITPAELDNKTVYISETARTITGEGVASASLTPLPKGTVLLSSRAPIGKVAITNVEMYCNQGFKNIVCGSRLNPRYLYSLLRFNTDYLNSLGRGATFKEISKRVVENIMIPVPQIDLQEEFERFSLQVDKLRFEACYAMYLLCAAFTLL